MKELEKGELITLDDEEKYLVLERIPCGLTTYLYLLLANSKFSFQFAKEEKQGNDLYITMVEDQEEERYVLDWYQRTKQNES